MDSSASAKKNPEINGIRQIMDKKDGLFRMNIVGKRVDFSARSVISPDPYINGGDIGIPLYFAKVMSFPESITKHNLLLLKQLIINGSDNYPGAIALENENGEIIRLDKKTTKQRKVIAELLQVNDSPNIYTFLFNRSKIVYRHLRNGDLLITNRQPTLHKVGIMAHNAKIQPTEHTIRMHYVNCAAFNADFDGDEINIHLPQNLLGQSEGQYIMHADRQYIDSTNGSPIRGLIQDHIIASVLLTKKDTFLTQREYTQ